MVNNIAALATEMDWWWRVALADDAVGHRSSSARRAGRLWRPDPLPGCRRLCPPTEPSIVAVIRPAWIINRTDLAFERINRGDSFACGVVDGRRPFTEGLTDACSRPARS